ncbi:peptidase E [Romeria aff. gracilis LEGE 07310]|uniref:Peptidase E n=1 Tax=Vasconcelosia minhoensis LEGE 07310 TaxID=915328 RepID=A0A8J7AUT4_9CYAN|nr:peptidase E [Romeria gracilis]MBE9079734.1 peptidase E [Romeria aff. gracilis LEGE 07310]
MSQLKRQIIALGGGGFSMEADNPLLDQYILAQSTSQIPKVCFIPTASGDSDSYIRRFYDAFNQLNCRPSHLSLFRPPVGGPDSFLREKDIIYVGGGSTFNMLAIWKAWKLDRVLRQAWENGTVLCGLSAGSLCWFEEGLSDSVVPGQYAKLRGLGFLKGSHCPHYDGESERRPAYHQYVASNELSSGIAADDGVALHYTDLRLCQVISSRPAAKAYRVSLEDNKVYEEVISPHYLGTSTEEVWRPTFLRFLER